MTIYTPPKSDLKDFTHKSRTRFRRTARLVLTIFGVLIWLYMGLAAIPEDLLKESLSPYQLVVSSASIVFSLIAIFLLSFSLTSFGQRTIAFSKYLSVCYFGLLVIILVATNGLFIKIKILSLLVMMAMLYINHIVIRANINTREHA